MSEQATLPEEQAAAAVPRLLEEHGGKIYHLGLRMCGGPEEAEDLVQETFLQAFRKWDQFEGRSAPTTWLYTIATRLCGRRKRRRSGEPRRIESLSELLPSGDEGELPLPSPEEGPLESQLRREMRERLEAELTELPASFRLPLVLKEIGELSIAEVAEILGLKPATVKTRIHRARLALQKGLAEELPRRAAEPADHSRGVCLDLLQAKQEALDRGVEFPVSGQELCCRCRSLFSLLDLTVDACHQLGSGPLPEPLRRKLLERLEEI